MAKVIRGSNMFFEDDIKIIDAELDSSLNLPALSVFSRDELQILYNGRVFIASKSPSKDRMKVYTLTFGLEETDSPKIQEDKYFSDNSAQISKIKGAFLEKVVNGISILDDKNSGKGKISPQLSEELANRIAKRYSGIAKLPSQSCAGKGLITKLNDSSVFNSEIPGYERAMILDKKIYDLITIQEYVEIFKSSVEPNFYTKLHGSCKTQAPEEISKLITDNKDKIHRKVLPQIRNKIWHSKRSSEICLDGAYWLPGYRGSLNDMNAVYQKLLEKKVKIDAARSLK